ncbi:ROK family protein [Paenibacillus lutimineralis]|uniref:ROK family protein n=1 Tax=Paenibacillus lutimineralis TaxID=2707005 RepID=A0A3S9V3C5_9BACL|nr:ROK family protein [Paenibacillus lutimineralis]AZS17091.1 ROK family protein [Paenibacillus lutimineralis]
MRHSEEVAIGLDIGGTNIKSGIVNAKGEVVHHLNLPTKAHEGGEALLGRIAGITKEMELYSDSKGWKVAGVGIGTAGQVNSRTGIVMGATANLPGWSGMELGERLQSQTGLSVLVDNDANAMAFGEAWVGSGRRWKDFICVTLGTGIGGCLIIDHRPYPGRDGFAGEIGHHVINFDGYPCNCGRTGCWEQYASATGLMSLVKEAGLALAEVHKPEMVFAFAQSGNEAAIHVLEQYTRYIATGLANMVHIFNPEGIVIGGAITRQGDFLLNPVRDQLSQQLLPVFRERAEEIEVVAASLGDNGGVVGAVAGYFI